MRQAQCGGQVGFTQVERWREGILGRRRGFSKDANVGTLLAELKGREGPS